MWRAGLANYAEDQDGLVTLKEDQEALKHLAKAAEVLVLLWAELPDRAKGRVAWIAESSNSGFGLRLNPFAPDREKNHVAEVGRGICHVYDLIQQAADMNFNFGRPRISGVEGPRPVPTAVLSAFFLELRALWLHGLKLPPMHPQFIYNDDGEDGRPTANKKSKEKAKTTLEKANDAANFILTCATQINPRVTASHCENAWRALRARRSRIGPAA